MISVLSMQMQQQKQKIFNGDGCRQEQDGVANCWVAYLRLINLKRTLLHLAGTKKLKLDRPLPKKWSVRDKTISSFVHTDKH